jgi:hypothetical protein
MLVPLGQMTWGHAPEGGQGWPEDVYPVLHVGSAVTALNISRGVCPQGWAAPGELPPWEGHQHTGGGGVATDGTTELRTRDPQNSQSSVNITVVKS